MKSALLSNALGLLVANWMLGAVEVSAAGVRPASVTHRYALDR